MFRGSGDESRMFFGSALMRLVDLLSDLRPTGDVDLEEHLTAANDALMAALARVHDIEQEARGESPGCAPCEYCEEPANEPRDGESLLCPSCEAAEHLEALSVGWECESSSCPPAERTREPAEAERMTSLLASRARMSA